MYIFSMPIDEAKTLESYIRYYRTLVLFEYSLTIITLFKFLDNIKIIGKVKETIIKMIFTIIIIIPITFYPTLLKKVFVI